MHFQMLHLNIFLHFEMGEHYFHGLLALLYRRQSLLDRGGLLLSQVAESERYSFEYEISRLRCELFMRRQDEASVSLQPSRCSLQGPRVLVVRQREYEEEEQTVVTRSSEFATDE